MKAITIYEPWASLILEGYKKYETRPWNTKHRGWIAIHASLRPMEEWNKLEMQRLGITVEPKYGQIIALAWLESSKPATRAGKTLLEQNLGDFSAGRYEWKFRTVVKIVPIKCRGLQRIWKVPKDVNPQIEL
jgi:activating signal cointegrator 1